MRARSRVIICVIGLELVGVYTTKSMTVMYG